MPNLSDLRLSKNMKYTALYVAMRFYEHTPDIFEKTYQNGTYIKIDSLNQSVYINNVKVFELDTHESFVKLECINRLLTLGYTVNDYELIDNTFEMNFKGYQIKFIVWDDAFQAEELLNKQVLYKSRLVSGVLEYKTKICDGEIYEYGLFEQADSINLGKQLNVEYNAPDFVIEENRVMRYVGKSKVVNVPDGIEELESSAFWDNQYIEEVHLPDSLTNMGGDTFYNCKNLRKTNIPSSVTLMGNNPFAGCPLIEITNESKSYVFEDGALYTADKKTMIYCSIKGDTTEFVIPEGVALICKHTFFLCDRFTKITLPSTLEKMENNPFVGCSNIHFESKSPYYKVVDGVLYNKDMSKIVCYPAWKAIGVVDIPDSVITLERGAFSGCKDMTAINLHNVNIVNKSCFTNCSSLKKIYCSDLITYIGEWAFAYCSSLEEVSVKKGTIIDNNAFSNCPAKLITRENYSNYLIESDNAYTLASMQKAYKGKIDSILIDPPYNSHIDYIGYQDGNYENGYLNFMEMRIKSSYKLLSDKGFLVINIDEGEVDNLTNLCVDIFGEPLVKVYKWKKLHEFFDANRNVNPNKKVVLYEYIIICKKTEKAHFNKIMQPYIENGELKEKVSEIPEVFDCFGTTSSAKDEICELFGKRDYFSTPKPLKLMKELIRATTSKDSLVMDFFAGSGTVGHACVDLNKEDSGNRKFILVCNNESNICENVTSKRLNKINAEYIFMK